MKKVLQHSRQLRQRMTDAEKVLWVRLRRKQLGVKFRRQESIGHFIVDFVCYKERLIVELDGGQHAESISDKERDKFFKSQNYKILRFGNHEVLNDVNAVVETIHNFISTSHGGYRDSSSSEI